MKTQLLLFSAIIALAVTVTLSQGKDVLLIASSRAYGRAPGVKPCDRATLVKTVKQCLTTDLRVRGNINVTFEEVYHSKTTQASLGERASMHTLRFQRHSLVQWYYWPDGHKERMANLQGKGKKKWDYVVVVGDNYLIRNMPGVYAEGVNLIARKVAEGSAKTVLLVPWNRSSDATRALAGVVCRVGKSARLRVIPRTIEFEMDRKRLGPYKGENPFAMKYVDTRNVTYHHTGTSSERGIEAAFARVKQACNIDMRRTKPIPGKLIVDFNFGRAWGGAPKYYKVDPKSYGRSYGFPLQDHSKTAAVTMLMGIDRQAATTDLVVANNMIHKKQVHHDVRCIPIRLMWAKIHELDPQLTPCRDRWHMSRYLDTASATYIYTLLSGRCPIGPKPDPKNLDAWRHYLGQKVGYETAWRMSHLTSRVPGFMVRPKTKITDLQRYTSQELDVKLHYAPKSDVTVTIKVEGTTKASVTPETLTFTTKNYAKAKKVKVTGKTAKKDTPFKVTFVTKSKDAVFDKLKDSWAFTVRSPYKSAAK